MCVNQEKGCCLHAPFLVLFSSFPWELLVDVGYWVRETWGLIQTSSHQRLMEVITLCLFETEE